MRSIVIDAAALEQKMDAFFAAKNVSVATGLIVGRMTASKDHIVRVSDGRACPLARMRAGGRRVACASCPCPRVLPVALIGACARSR